MIEFDDRDMAIKTLDLAGELSQSVVEFIEGQPIDLPIQHHETVKLFSCLVCSALYHKVIMKEAFNDIEPKEAKEVIHGMLDQFLNDPDIELSKHMKH
jgi:hypothetical protein